MIAFNDLIAATPPPDTPPAEGGVKKHGLRIAKSDDERMLAFGWASVAIRVDGEQIEDRPGRPRKCCLPFRGAVP